MTTGEYIRMIGPIIQSYARKFGYQYPSAIIAQAMVESGNGNSLLAARYHNHFGIKWWKGCGKPAINMNTKEEYIPGVLSNTAALWCVYSSIQDCVEGYFYFLEKNSRYKNVRNATSSYNYLELIRAAGYATSSTYVTNCYSRITKNNLLIYDIIPDPTPVNYAGIVTATALRVREGASTADKILQVAGHDLLLPKGICIAFDAEFCGWAKLAGINGWVSLAYINKG